MNQTPGLLGATVRGARWGFPWLSTLAISASVAYAITVGVAHAPSAGDAPTTISAAQAQAQALVRNLLQSGLSPSDVADRVLDAIREEQLYILTHPEMSEIVRQRFDNILAQRNPVPRTLA